MISDNQRRLVCRIFFLLVCVAPTATVFYQICHPQTALQWQREIRAQLGVATIVDAIETPGPFVTTLRGLKFVDAELGTILDAIEVRIEFGDTNLVTISQQVRLTNAGLLHLVQTINEHLIRNHAADRPWQIHFLDQTIIQESIIAQETGDPFPATLVASNLQINVEPIIGGTMTKMQFQLPEIDPEQFVYCELERRHPDAKQHSQQEFRLNTNKMALPCWLLGDLIPEIKILGPDCQFAGLVNVNPGSGHPHGWFMGEFTQIDSRAITGEANSSPLVQFKADVKICRLDGGVEQLEAFLTRPDGSSTPIRNTLTLIEQFDVLRALRTAAETNQFQRADSRF